jgi:2-oxoglutarate ferredoxin oxidoreductase subunit gamma
MRRIIQVRLAGFGGQGIVLMGLILGRAGALDGRHVSGSNSYGAQVRGSACKSEVILSHDPIDYPHVIKADVLAVLSQGAYAAYHENVTDAGLILFDQTSMRPQEPYRVCHRGVAASDYALKRLEDARTANMVMLGALVAMTGIVSVDAVRKAISMNVGETFRAVNLRAFAGGLELVGGIDNA